jgi:hypothetical protein
MLHFVPQHTLIAHFGTISHIRVCKNRVFSTTHSYFLVAQTTIIYWHAVMQEKTSGGVELIVSRVKGFITCKGEYYSCKKRRRTITAIHLSKESGSLMCKYKLGLVSCSALAKEGVFREWLVILPLPRRKVGICVCFDITR